MGVDFIKDNQDQRAPQTPANPGLSAEFPQVEFHSGGANVNAFNRMEPIESDHQRMLAEHGGSGSSETPASHHVGSTPAFYKAEGRSVPGDNTQTLLDLTANQLPQSFDDPARASEFARPVGSTVAGSADNAATAIPRAPISPEDALFGQGRLRGDSNLQSEDADLVADPTRFQGSRGREGNPNGDRNRPTPINAGPVVGSGAPSWKSIGQVRPTPRPERGVESVSAEVAKFGHTRGVTQQVVQAEAPKSASPEGIGRVGSSHSIRSTLAELGRTMRGEKS